VSDASEDPTGPSDAGAEPTSDRPLGAWTDPTPEPAWTQIAVEAESAGPDPAPATEAGRPRRPSSLRSAVESASSVPRRKLTPPPFPKRDAEPGPEPPAGGSPAPARNPGPSAVERLSAPLEKLPALVKERPEVGLGMAFAGGLLLATILKRLAR
jgi:hypothetical protein